MSYRSNIRTLLMRGKMFRQKGFKLAGVPTVRRSSGSGFALGGTISHRPLNPDLISGFERFRISHGKGISSQAVTGSILSSLERINAARRKKSSTKKSSAKKSSVKKKKANFKSLKFNF